MIADRHYWRTADGRYVATGHTDAEVLAYPAGTELTDDEARALGLLDDKKPAAAKPDTKAAAAPPNKARAKPADK